jgi:competence protein ComEC
MSTETFFTIGIGIVSGIAFRSFFDTDIAELLFLVFLVCTLFIAQRIMRAHGVVTSCLLLSTLFCVAFLLGVWRMDMQHTGTSPYAAYVGETVAFSGSVVEDPEVRETYIQLILKGDGRERILVRGDTATIRRLDIAYGDQVTATGMLERPEPFLNETGRVFPYDMFLRSKHIEYIIPYADIALDTKSGVTVRGTLFQVKHAFMRSIETVLPEPHAGLGEGILLGVKRALGTEMESVFQTAGITHIVVLSGYNMLIVAESVMWLLAFFFLPRTRMLAAISIVILFALLVGLGASVVRASLMTMLLILAQGIGRSYGVLRALMLAGVLMLLHNPYLLIYDPGFQLSFLATLGLVLVFPRLLVYMHHLPSWYGLKHIFAATLGTQIFVLPFLLYQMGTFSVVSIVVNVLVLPLVPFAMLATFLGGIAGFIHAYLGMIIAFPAYIALEYIIRIATMFASLPFASIPLPTFPFWIVVFLYGCIALWIMKSPREDDDDTIVAVSRDTIYSDWTIEEKSVAEHIKKDTIPFR